MDASQEPRPLEREDAVDELRGLALLGIALVNAPWLAISSRGLTDASIAGTLDRAAAFLVFVLAQGKFYLLFSFLFGYSMRYHDGSVATRRRRLVGLGLLGVAHGLLLFEGDILLPYALCGFVLLALRGGGDRRLFAAATVGFLLWAAMLGLLAILDPAADPRPASALEAPDLILSEGGWLDGLRVRASLWQANLVTGALFMGGSLLGAMCIGELASRRRATQRPHHHRRRTQTL